MLKNKDVVPPGNLCSKFLHKFILIRIELIKLLHVIQIAPRKSLHTFEFAREVLGDLVDHGVPPSARPLLLDDQLANVPVEGNQLAIDGEGRLDLRRPDAGLQVGDEGAVVVRGAEIVVHRGVPGFFLCHPSGISYPAFPSKKNAGGTRSPAEIASVPLATTPCLKV